MATQDPDSILNKRIKRKIRTLKPYEKKFIKQGEFRYDVPVTTSIEKGNPTVCYAKNLNLRHHHAASSTFGQSSSQRNDSQPKPPITLSNSNNDFTLVTDKNLSTCDSIPAEDTGTTYGIDQGESFLDGTESYFHQLKVENGISIFAECGRVLVIRDFCTAKQKLYTEKWNLIERKCASFSDGNFYWVYLCSCNQTFARQIAALDDSLNTSHEDFLNIYPDCLHVTVARKIFAHYDLINCIEASAETNLGNDADHEYAVRQNILFEVPDSTLICCYAPELRLFGLVDLKSQRLTCQTCKTYSCKHITMMNRLKSSGELYCQFPDVMDNVTTRCGSQKKSYQPKLLSYKRILFSASPQLSEGLQQLTKNSDFTTLFPEEGICRHCGNNLLEGDPVENNWLAYDCAVIITNTNVSYAKAYFRPCTVCDSVSFFEGQSKCLLNLGTYLVGYDVLRSYMHSFLHGSQMTWNQIWNSDYSDEKGVCYGFQVMQSNESPNVPFTIFRTRFKTAPKYIIYDNACKLHAYCISRDPMFFRNTEFYVDRLHWENHTSCSVGYNLSLYPQFDYINSQLSEQSNAGLQRIKDQLSYMTANNFMKHCTFYLWNKNREKLSKNES